MTPGEIQRVVDVNKIKHIHLGHVASFTSTGLLIGLVKFRPFKTMSELEVNQWDELSQFLLREIKFTDAIAKNGALLEVFMIPMCHTQILTPVQDPDASNAKPCAVNPYARAAFRQCQQFLMPVQAPDASHTKSLCLYRMLTIQIIPYAGAASRQLRHFLMWVQAPNASHTNPYNCAGSQQSKQLLRQGQASDNSQPNTYPCTGSQCFARTSLCLYRFLGIQTIPYAWAASRQF
ncbi:hypothetical protein O181_040076 [Austropuccinia psidii MF-1]|uniref:Uncharacterized protein n=1 Tax=Austropuccinia psidii MF-1 TaxID=1389203 RepID=A0A9Q3DH41_9BASI|nr:hypothetical protein [Austropuccinia psidii MF-1]